MIGKMKGKQLFSLINLIKKAFLSKIRLKQKKDYFI